MAQSRKDRMDESLGMRRGAEKDMKQSYKARRHESEGAEHAMSRRDKERGERSGMSYRTFDVKDNQQAWEVRPINTNSEQYDLDRIRPYSDGSKGYPAEAWNYRY
jgi:hypothetical protein